MANYRARVSGPLIDRFEIQVEVSPLPVRDLAVGIAGEPSAAVAARVAAARRLQEERFAGTGCASNAAMTSSLLPRHARLDEASRRILDLAIYRLALSARAHDGILRVARTIADLDGGQEIEAAHVGEAIQYRALDRGANPTSEV